MDTSGETLQEQGPRAIEWLPDRSQSYIIFGFTGQGQQRPDMLKPWYGYSDDTNAVLRHFHDVTETPYGRLLNADELERGPLMQPANVTLGVVGSMALAYAGIRPNEVFGHSLGEYGAVFSAGFVDADEIITLSKKRGECTDMNIRELLKEQVPTGMMAVSAKTGDVVSKVSDVLHELGIPEFELGISNFNSEDQVVISGQSKHFEDIKAALRRPLRATVLKVDGPYHNLHMRLAKMAFQGHVDDLAIREPKSPTLYSPTTVKRLKDRKDVASMLVNQLVSPVLYSQLIDARLKYLNQRRILSLLSSNKASEIVFTEIGPYASDKPPDIGVLIGMTKKNVLTYHEGNMPIRFHRVSAPEDIYSA